MVENARSLDKSKTKEQLIYDLQSLRQKTTDSDRLLNDILAMYKEAPIGLCVFDQKLRFRHINNWLAEINGVPAEEHLGHSIFEILPDVAQGIEQQLLRVFETGDPIIGGKVEAETPAHPGIKMVYQHSYYPLKLDGTTVVGVSCVVEDITKRIRAEQELHEVLNDLEDRVEKRTRQFKNANTRLQEEIRERKKSEELLAHQANHDALTELVNRREFERRAEGLLSSSKHNGDNHVLCFMDLDQFKVVNDTCNHDAGDEILRQVSSVLAGKMRKRDTLARLGGDEFGILMEHCSLQHAYRVVKTLQMALQDYQFIWGKHKFKIGLSIGMVDITKDTNTIAEALKQADGACYLSKEQGRGRINIYRSEDAGLIRRQAETRMVEKLYRAIEENQLHLYAQPILPLDGSSEVHHEILLRMRDEEENVLSPSDFLSAAERYSLMVILDLWVIERCFNCLENNTDFQKSNNFCSINLSGQSLTDLRILILIKEKLRETGVQGNKICFEITETSAISNLNEAVKFISTLKKLGCRFALDDFGSGLSSFAYLKKLPVDFIKIDGAFVKNIANDPVDCSIVKSINEIGHLMGKRTIAEGVEDEEALEMLTEIGVDYIQGFFVGHPSPIGASTWIDNRCPS